jgi:hypothetical protein
MKCNDFMVGLVLVGMVAACERAGSADASRVTSFSEKVPSLPASAPAMSASPSAGVSNGPKSVVAKSLAMGSTLAPASTLRVKRLLVTTGVKDREPLADGAALPSDGTPIYAFAELSNPDGESENVRITFERQGGAERVGNVTLPVPGKVSRHRTWATTRFIRAPGVWEAVLWSEGGSELGRTSFEVATAS